MLHLTLLGLPQVLVPEEAEGISSVQGPNVSGPGTEVSGAWGPRVSQTRLLEVGSLLPRPPSCPHVVSLGGGWFQA